ncbi:hypothetical protein [Rhodoplanes azumiensis]|uniref:Uncharacterized protein n=1 Tax=Rhodoplanes azumiensis TaxID=1897628 RepID=A0ABW5AMR0_9BRAD
MNRAANRRATPTTTASAIDETAPPARALILCVAVLGGVAATIAAQLAFARFGLDLGAAWRDMMGLRSGQMRSAFAWWAIALTAFAAGFLIALVTRWLSRTEADLAILHWIGGLALVAGLALAGHAAGAPAGLPVGAATALGLTTLAAAGLLSLLGGYFATRR